MFPRQSLSIAGRPGLEDAAQTGLPENATVSDATHVDNQDTKAVEAVPVAQSSPTWPIDNRMSQSNPGWTPDSLNPRFTAKQIQTHNAYANEIESQLDKLFNGTPEEQRTAKKALPNYIGKRVLNDLTPEVWTGTDSITGLKDRLAWLIH